jgi:hypothetical protein
MVTDDWWLTEHIHVEGGFVYYQRSIGGSSVPVVHIHDPASGPTPEPGSRHEPARRRTPGSASSASAGGAS